MKALTEKEGGDGQGCLVKWTPPLLLNVMLVRTARLLMVTVCRFEGTSTG